jgi:hypothetical protein
MEAEKTSETSVPIYQTTRRQISENINVLRCGHNNDISHSYCRFSIVNLNVSYLIYKIMPWAMEM